MSWQVSIEVSDAVSASKYVRKFKNRIHYMEGLVEGLMVACQLESIIGALLVLLTMGEKLIDHIGSALSTQSFPLQIWKLELL